MTFIEEIVAFMKNDELFSSSEIQEAGSRLMSRMERMNAMKLGLGPIQKTRYSQALRTLRGYTLEVGDKWREEALKVIATYEKGFRKEGE